MFLCELFLFVSRIYFCFIANTRTDRFKVSVAAHMNACAHFAKQLAKVVLAVVVLCGHCICLCFVLLFFLAVLSIVITLLVKRELVVLPFLGLWFVYFISLPKKGCTTKRKKKTFGRLAAFCNVFILALCVLVIFFSSDCQCPR